MCTQLLHVSIVRLHDHPITAPIDIETLELIKARLPHGFKVISDGENSDGFYETVFKI